MLKFFLALVFMCALPLKALSTDNVRPHLSLKDLSKIKRVISAKMSPDGQYIAYVTTNPRKVYHDDDGHNWRELYVLNKKGEIVPFITGQEAIGQIQWAGNSQYLWFLAKRGDDEFVSINIIDMKGGEAQKIVNHETHISGFAVSKDNKKLIYWAEQRDLVREGLEKKGFNARVFEEDEAQNNLWLVEFLKTENTISLIKHKHHIIDAQFMPDGKRILVQDAPSALADDVIMRKSLRLINLAGKELIKFEHQGKMGKVLLSANGRQVAVIGSQDAMDPSEGRLLVARTNQSKLRHILPDFAGHVRDIAWLSNRTVAFIGHKGTGSLIGSKSISDESSDYKTLEFGSLIHNSISAEVEGKDMAVIAHTGEHPPEVYKLKNRSLSRISHSNPWLAGYQLAKQESISFMARDGIKIEGILIRPLKKTEQASPLLIFVHGGPENHVSNGWISRYSRPVQYAAAMGYASFLPNYRGSTGRGVAFTKSGQGDYAGAEFNDLLDAKKHLVKEGIALADKTGITGSSYGGYAAAWAATAMSEHFAAAVMSMGISNQLSKFGTTDIPTEMHQLHAQKLPWHDWQWMLERSPLFYVEKAKTPLLIMHGELDSRVDLSQAMELYRALKTLRLTPVRLVIYPQEGHGFSRNAAKLDYSIRLMRWMDAFLLSENKQTPIQLLEHGSYEQQKEPK
jgi:dipeptidyl aminopeptidase/acylaminoacyl peptidase